MIVHFYFSLVPRPKCPCGEEGLVTAFLIVCTITSCHSDDITPSMHGVRVHGAIQVWPMLLGYKHEYLQSD